MIVWPSHQFERCLAQSLATNVIDSLSLATATFILSCSSGPIWIQTFTCMWARTVRECWAFFFFFSLHNPFVFAWSLVGVVDCECRIHTISGSDLSGWNCGDQRDRRPRSETNWCHWSCELLCFFSACCLSHASLSICLCLSLPPSLPLCFPLSAHPHLSLSAGVSVFPLLSHLLRWPCVVHMMLYSRDSLVISLT